jgi:hypothetical protein
MKPALLLAFSAFVLFACSNSKEKKEETPVVTAETDVPVRDSVLDTQSGDSVPPNIQIDSVIHLAFPKDSVSVTVKGHLDKKGEPVICLLPVVQGKQLTARVTAEKKNATIRFSHIDFPDGEADGPFGNSIKYDLKQKGTYKLYIAPNRMAGDPISTDFILNVRVE